MQRRGKDVAAIIPVEDLRFLERLIEEEEDSIDLAASRAWLAEPGEPALYSEVHKRLDWDNRRKARQGFQRRVQEGIKLQRLSAASRVVSPSS